MLVGLAGARESHPSIDGSSAGRGGDTAAKDCPWELWRPDLHHLAQDCLASRGSYWCGKHPNV